MKQFEGAGKHSNPPQTFISGTPVKLPQWGKPIYWRAEQEAKTSMAKGRKQDTVQQGKVLLGCVQLSTRRKRSPSTLKGLGETTQPTGS